METKIKLKPGYDPDKYRDKLCEIFNKNQGTMTMRDYMIYRSEKLRKSPLFRKFENEDEALKPENKEAK
ncbi:MAG: hypothetical protein FWG98_06545 [Candidatus Cloacimonetes bacterium]|nr:hypothetical protein [Candidatus Cloacimonadota bacterium]